MSLLFLLSIILFNGGNLMIRGLELKSQELYSVGSLFVFSGFVLSIFSFFLLLWMMLGQRQSS